MQFLTSKVSSCSPYQKKTNYFKSQQFLFVRAIFGQERKSPENGKEIGHCVSLQLERRKREVLAKVPNPKSLTLDWRGRRVGRGEGGVAHTREDWGIGPECLAARKELAWRKISTNCMRVGCLFQDGHSQGFHHHQAEATWAGHSVRTLPWLTHIFIT